MPQVVLTRKAAGTIREDLKARVEKELAQVFADDQIVLVQECLEGYSREQHRKLILAVEVHFPAKRASGPFQIDYASHVVKLGDADRVADYENWAECFGGGSTVSHVFLSPRPHDLGAGRAAVVYADARQPSRGDADGGGIRTLESAAEQGVRARGIRLESVERVIAQVYAELESCLYRSAQEDVRRARAFYRRKLKLEDDGRAIAHAWTDKLLRLRKEAVWLFCSAYPPDHRPPHRFVDPYDYLSWVLGEPGEVPPTLVGCAHGDLHGRNVLVVVREDEAERPTVIDYDDMGRENVLAWDFVKLEMELKARLLVPLFYQARVCDGLFAAARAKDPAVELGHVLRAWELRRPTGERAAHLRRLLCFYLFEQALAELTGELHQTQRPEKIEPPGKERLPGVPELDNLLLLLLTIRRQAACVLGGLPWRANRHDWFDEYHFALAAYGLSTAKFSTYDLDQSAAALVSAGVAVGQLRLLPKQFDRFHKSGPTTTATYQVALNQGYDLWTQGGLLSNLPAAKARLGGVKDRFRYAVPFLREYFLVLASADELAQARTILEELVTSVPAGRDPLDILAKECCQFGDFETLCRIGRLFKDEGDSDWEKSKVPFAELASTTAGRCYRTACLYYTTAFEISQDFFPGENAALTALLAGEDEDKVTDLANSVLTACGKVHLSFSRNDFWLFCTEGTLHLLRSEKGTKPALMCFTKALEVFEREGRPMGKLQSAYNTLCRLCAALGSKRVLPVVRLLHDAKVNLEPGPLNNCGLGPRKSSARKSGRPRAV